MKNGFVILILIVSIILISGCAEKIEKPSEPIKPVEKQPLPKSGGQCPDSICDEFELKEGLCAEDCKGVEGWQGKEQQTEQPIMQEPQGPSKKDITVETLQSSYKTVTTKPSGWFTTGQDADIMLSGIGFNNAGGPLLFNHPGTVVSDGTHLLLADRNNNRVLIWNTLPTANTPPDLVLGQKDFTSNNPGKGLDQMNWPVSVSAANGKVVVTDTYNNRIIIWNSFPTKNGQPADLMINTGQTGYNAKSDAEKKRSIQWPWGIWTDGKKLAVSSTENGIILLWNNFPIQNDQQADIFLTGKGDIGTPRTITSDGTHLIVGDHNARKCGPGSCTGNFFWKNWPTSDDAPYDFFTPDPSDPHGVWMQGVFTNDGKLVMFGARLHIWNLFPQNANDKPDVSVGGASGGKTSSGYYLLGGDGSGVALADNKLYISLDNGNKIVVFNSLPTRADDKPDFAIGSPDINTNTLDTNFIMSNPIPATDGKSLFVSSDFDSRLYVWKNLPDENNAKPDFVYNLEIAPWDNELFKNKFVLAGKDKVYIWNSLPVNGELPDIMFERNIGSVTFNEIKGVTMDDKYFYIADTNKIYVWEGVPEKNTNPKLSIDALSATRLSSDGKYLVVAATEAPFDERIKFYKVEGLSSNSKPVLLKGVTVNLPQAALASEGHLFIGDTGFNRVLIWNSIDDAVSGKSPNVVLGEKNIDDTVPEIGKDKLFWPAGLAFDGSYLWVGEFKFSERIMRFSIR